MGPERSDTLAGRPASAAVGRGRVAAKQRTHGAARRFRPGHILPPPPAPPPPSHALHASPPPPPQLLLLAPPLRRLRHVVIVVVGVRARRRPEAEPPRRRAQPLPAAARAQPGERSLHSTEALLPSARAMVSLPAGGFRRAPCGRARAPSRSPGSGSTYCIFGCV